MRDPARIPRILEALRVEWEKQPDLRLGQLLMNAVVPYGDVPDLYQIEDQPLVDAVRLTAPVAKEK